MIQLRTKVFETNSSSTHSINICTESEWSDWKNGKTLFNPYTGKFMEIQSNNEDTTHYMTFDDFWEDDDYEGYEQPYETVSGDKIVIFGKYGYDG